MSTVNEHKRYTLMQQMVDGAHMVEHDRSSLPEEVFTPSFVAKARVWGRGSYYNLQIRVKISKLCLF